MKTVQQGVSSDRFRQQMYFSTARFSGLLPLWKTRAMLDMYPVAPAVYMMNKDDTAVEVKWRDKLVGEHSSLKIKCKLEQGQENNRVTSAGVVSLSCP